MTHFKRSLLIILILISCVGCDQITKSTARKYLSRSQTISYCHDTFRLHYIENYGGFFGIGSTLPMAPRFWVLTLLTGGIVAGLLVFILVNQSLRPAFVSGFSLIIGGGIGNLIDRTMNHGAVIDFMNIGVNGLRTGIFNIADVAIMAGAGMVMVFAARNRGQLEKTV